MQKAPRNRETKKHKHMSADENPDRSATRKTRAAKERIPTKTTLFMSKRLISLAGRQYSKRIRVERQLGRMRNLVKAADGAMGDETPPSPHLPATCQLLETPIKSKCDKKEYR